MVLVCLVEDCSRCPIVGVFCPLPWLATIWDDVLQNVVWCLGNGQDITFCYDPWIGDLGRLAQYTLSAVDGALVRAIVSDMMWEKFHEFLLMYVLMRMTAVKGPTRNLLSDHVAPWSDYLEPLEQGWVQINVDGARRQGDSVIASRGAIRDASGVWQPGFAWFIDIGNVVEAEL
ncbi:hypothetical protein V6N13_106957 [Hibiscus sabdariffa]|uniref:Uncharacterized protein n=1 Tax=Hibiscus sabdariffa TaxID=183260 RepID=A0ABR2F2A6_9ROSI